jgi:predicted permease
LIVHWRHWSFIVPLRLRSIFRGQRVEADMEDELQFHIEQNVCGGVARGLTRDQAYFEAVRAMDGLAQRKEEIRDMRHIHWLSDFVQDLHYAFRSLGHARGFTMIVVTTLALGLGVNSAIFSLADALLLRPLSVLRPSEVVAVGTSLPTQSFGSLSYPDYVDYRDQSKCFDGLVAFTQMTGFGFASQPNELPRVIGGMGVSENFFRVLGVAPDLGRGFRPDEDRVSGRDAVAVIGHDFWQQHFNGDQAIVGRSVQLNGLRFTIIGVAPERFTGMDQYVRPAFFVPLHMYPLLSTNSQRDLLLDRADRDLVVKGRLKKGFSTATAAAELAVIAGNLASAYPKTNRNIVAQVKTELALRVSRDQTDASLAAMLLALAGAVLLVACANVASLLLSRSKMRAREIAVRLAMGAGRSRLVRLLLTESFLLAFLGGGAGLALGYAGIRFFARFKIPTDLPIALSVQMDRRVLVFSLTASILSAIFFGLAPALQTTRPNLVTALKTSDIDVPGQQKHLWGRSSLVVLQVAASMVLLIVSAGIIRNFRAKWNSGPGFRDQHLLSMSFDPQLVRLNAQQTRLFYQELVKRARTVPGVTSAALTEALPMATDSDGIDIVPDGYYMPSGKESFNVQMNIIDDEYFHTLDVQMLRGRVFGDADTAESPRVAVVNEQFAKHYFAGRDALGKRFRLDNLKGVPVEIVGISKTAKYNFIAEGPTEFVYLPFSQRPHSQMTLIVATLSDSDSLAAPLREMVRGLDPRQPVFDVRTIEDFYKNRVVGAPQLILKTVTAMSLTGLILAIAGLYGLVTYGVSRRTREIGIRMAIGASRRSVLVMVMRQGLVLVLAGTVIGLVLGVFAQRGINTIFGDSSLDVMSFVVAACAMLIVTMLAAYIPGRRASRIEPMRALRYE